MNAMSEGGNGRASQRARPLNRATSARGFSSGANGVGLEVGPFS